MHLGVVLGRVVVDHHRFCRALLTNQQYSLALLCNQVHQELGSDVVHHWHKDGAVLRGVVSGVAVLVHTAVPVVPFTWVIKTDFIRMCVKQIMYLKA